MLFLIDKASFNWFYHMEGIYKLNILNFLMNKLNYHLTQVNEQNTIILNIFYYHSFDL